MLEKLQEVIKINQEWISWRCAEHLSAVLAWKWRSDRW